MIVIVTISRHNYGPNYSCSLYLVISGLVLENISECIITKAKCLCCSHFVFFAGTLYRSTDETPLCYS